MSHQFAVAAHWSGNFDEAALQHWAEKLRSSLEAPKVTFGLVFITPRFFEQAKQILEIIRVHARVPLLAGCSSQSLISGADEIEENAGITLGLYHLPHAELKAFHFRQE